MSRTSASFTTPGCRQGPAFQPVNTPADSLKIRITAESREQGLCRILAAQALTEPCELISNITVVHRLAGAFQDLNRGWTPGRPGAVDRCLGCEGGECVPPPVWRMDLKERADMVGLDRNAMKSLLAERDLFSDPNPFSLKMLEAVQ